MKQEEFEKIIADAFAVAKDIAIRNPVATPDIVEVLQDSGLYEDPNSPTAYVIIDPGSENYGDVFYNPEFIREIAEKVRESAKVSFKASLFTTALIVFLHELYHIVFGGGRLYEEGKKLRPDLTDSTIATILNIFHDVVVNEYAVADAVNAFLQGRVNYEVLASAVTYVAKALEEKNFVFLDTFKKFMEKIVEDNKKCFPNIDKVKDFLDYAEEEMYSRKGYLEDIVERLYFEFLKMVKCPIDDKNAPKDMKRMPRQPRKGSRKKTQKGKGGKQGGKSKNRQKGQHGEGQIPEDSDHGEEEGEEGEGGEKEEEKEGGRHRKKHSGKGKGKGKKKGGKGGDEREEGEEGEGGEEGESGGEREEEGDHGGKQGKEKKKGMKGKEKKGKGGGGKGKEKEKEKGGGGGEEEGEKEGGEEGEGKGRGKRGKEKEKERHGGDHGGSGGGRRGKKGRKKGKDRGDSSGEGGGGGSGREGGEEEGEEGGEEEGGEKGGKDRKKGKKGSDEGQGDKGSEDSIGKAQPATHSKGTSGVGHRKVSGDEYFDIDRIIEEYGKELSKSWKGVRDSNAKEIIDMLNKLLDYTSNSSIEYVKRKVESSIKLDDMLAGYIDEQYDWTATRFGRLDPMYYELEDEFGVLIKPYAEMKMGEKPMVIWVVDTSGSVSDFELNGILNVVAKHADELEKQYVVAFSDAAYGVEVTDSSEIGRVYKTLISKTGRGGTNIEAALKLVSKILRKEADENPRVVVVFLSDFFFGKILEEVLEEFKEALDEYGGRIGLFVSTVNDMEPVKEFRKLVEGSFDETEVYRMFAVNDEIYVTPFE